MSVKNLVICRMHLPSLTSLSDSSFPGTLLVPRLQGSGTYGWGNFSPKFHNKKEYKLALQPHKKNCPLASSSIFWSSFKSILILRRVSKRCNRAIVWFSNKSDIAQNLCFWMPKFLHFLKTYFGYIFEEFLVFQGYFECANFSKIIFRGAKE